MALWDDIKSQLPSGSSSDDSSSTSDGGSSDGSSSSGGNYIPGAPGSPDADNGGSTGPGAGGTGIPDAPSDQQPDTSGSTGGGGGGDGGSTGPGAGGTGIPDAPSDQQPDTSGSTGGGESGMGGGAGRGGGGIATDVTEDVQQGAELLAPGDVTYRDFYAGQSRRTGKQARDLERRVLAANPDLTAADVRIVRTARGYEPRLTASGRRKRASGVRPNVGGPTPMFNPGPGGTGIPAGKSVAESKPSGPTPVFNPGPGGTGIPADAGGMNRPTDTDGLGQELQRWAHGASQAIEQATNPVAEDVGQQVAGFINSNQGATELVGGAVGGVLFPGFGQSYGRLLARKHGADFASGEASGAVKTPGDIAGGFVGLAAVEGAAATELDEALSGVGPGAQSTGQTLGSIVGGPAGSFAGRTLALAYKPDQESSVTPTLESGAELAEGASNYATSNPKGAATDVAEFFEGVAETEADVGLSTIAGSGPAPKAVGSAAGGIFGGAAGSAIGRNFASSYRPGGESSVTAAAEAAAASEAGQYARNNPFELGGRVGGQILVGAATGYGLSKGATTARDVVRTVGGREVAEEELVNVGAISVKDPFPAAENPTLYKSNPAAAVRRQASEYTPSEVDDFFTQYGIEEGSVLKKALDVEPDGPGYGSGGFSSPPAEGQVYESPGSFFGPELSKYFLRTGTGESSRSFSPVPGMPSVGGKPTGVLAKVPVENTAADDLAGFNMELIGRAGDDVAITKPPSAVATEEIEAVVPPETEFAAVGDRSVLNRLGVGSRFYTKIDERTVPGTNIGIPGTGRRVPLRPVASSETAAAAEGTAGPATAEGAASNPLSYYMRAPTSQTSRPAPFPYGGGIFSTGEATASSGMVSESSSGAPSAADAEILPGVDAGDMSGYNRGERPPSSSPRAILAASRIAGSASDSNAGSASSPSIASPTRASGGPSGGGSPSIGERGYEWPSLFDGGSSTSSTRLREYRRGGPPSAPPPSTRVYNPPPPPSRYPYLRSGGNEESRDERSRRGIGLGLKDIHSIFRNPLGGRPKPKRSTGGHRDDGHVAALDLLGGGKDSPAGRDGQPSERTDIFGINTGGKRRNAPKATKSKGRQGSRTGALIFDAGGESRDSRQSIMSSSQRNENPLGFLGGGGGLPDFLGGGDGGKDSKPPSIAGESETNSPRKNPVELF